MQDNQCVIRGSGLLGSYMANQQGDLKDPLKQLRTLGNQLLKISSGFFASMISDSWTNEKSLLDAHAAVDGTRTTGVGSVWSLNYYNPVGRAGIRITNILMMGVVSVLNSIDQVIMNVYKPIGFAIAGIIYGIGIILGYFLPYLPAVLYIMALIGWLLLVIEAVIAAPIIALGLANPSHHDLLGKAEQSLILLLQVFLRPACILIGLVMSMLMLYVSLNYLNMGFLYFVGSNALFNINNDATDATILIKDSVVIGGVLVMYAYLCYVIVTHCLSLIYVIPERISRWLDPNKGDPQAIALAGQQIESIEQQLSGEGGSSSKITSGASQSGQRGLSVSTTGTSRSVMGRVQGKNEDDLEREQGNDNNNDRN